MFILGYSMGALVAFDYLCPRTSQLELPDDRHVDAIRALITVGSPLDFMRLYLPQYVANRQPRVQDLPWSNVSIPADVLGSNCTDVNDHIVPAPEQIVEVAGMKPSRIVQFTEEKLTWSGIRARRGFPRAQGEQKVLRPGRWIAVSTAAYAGDWAYVVFLSPHGGDNQLFPLLILGGGTAYLGVLIASMGAIINWQDRRSGRQPPRRPALA